jgi:hypothetical protein
VQKHRASAQSNVRLGKLASIKLCLMLTCVGGVIALTLAAVPAVAQPQSIIALPPACDEPAVMNGGVVAFPQAATDIEGQIDVDEDHGPLAILYPDLDTTTDAFYPLPCAASIGGTLPPGANDPPSADELAAEQYLEDFEANVVPRIIAGIRNTRVNLPSLAGFTIGSCSIGPAIPVVPCDSPQLLLSGQPFEGRDIIYVHGYSNEHLEKWLANDSGAHKLWPQDSSEFLNPTGYFRGYARDYWNDHIRENLFDPVSPTNTNAGYEWPSGSFQPAYRPKSNRYLLVSWSSNQTLEYAQHALLAQIRLAMMYGTNVVTPPTYPHTRVVPFCANKCIIISHSTGGLIVSSALALAQQCRFGPGAVVIASHIRAHVALAGAISGSRLAAVAMALGILNTVPSSGASAVLCPIQDKLFNTTGSCSLNTGFVVHTILRDLTPLVAQQAWGSAVGASPVPTVTVAGGHPLGNYGGVTKLPLPGLDDGVVTMNSACGNPLPVNPPWHAASGAAVVPIQGFDMGIPLVRALRNYIDQKPFPSPPPFPLYMAGACTPWRSPTGMVMPLAAAMGGTQWDTRKRYPNHFSFIQGSIDHSNNGGGDLANPWPSKSGGPASLHRDYREFLSRTVNEEMSAITDAGIYAKAADATYLVKPTFAAEMHEFVRGKKVSFKLFGRRITWWIWKRTYHLLNRYPSKASAHYVYEFVARR